MVPVGGVLLQGHLVLFLSGDWNSLINVPMTRSPGIAPGELQRP